MRLRPIACIVVVFGWLTWPAAVLAHSPLPTDHCSCQTILDAAVAFDRAGAVFLGQVLELTRPNEKPLAMDWLERLPGVTLPGYAAWRASLAVTDSWKGVDATRVTVQTPFGVDCGVGFGVGGQYVVYANSSRTGWVTSTCAGTTEFSTAAPDLSYLRNRPKLKLHWPLDWQAFVVSSVLAVGLMLWLGVRWVRRGLASFEH